MDGWQIITSILGTAGGMTAVVSLILFFRQIKRKKTIDADEVEIKNLKDIINTLKKEVERQNERITILEELNGVKDKEIMALERENVIFKRALNCQIECGKESPNCPVLTKYNQLMK